MVEIVADKFIDCPRVEALRCTRAGFPVRSRRPAVLGAFAIADSCPSEEAIRTESSDPRRSGRDHALLPRAHDSRCW